jgi:flagellar hook protein FlgE
MAAAISGLRNHQVYMDVVANNIANVNTNGFKASRVNFKDAIAQTAKAGSQPTASTGGTNPVQVGLGINMGSVDTLMGQGSLISTGKNTDLAIQGEGFFVLGSGDISATDEFTPAYFTRDGAFGLDEDGYLVERVSGYYVLSTTAGGAAGTYAPVRVGKALDGTDWSWSTFNIGSDGKLTGIMANGASDTDPTHQPQIALAKFPNPEGMVKSGGNLFQSGPNAGTAVLAAPGDVTAGLGTLVPGALEASNVDLAEQFSRMIMAQRGFQANSRAITASDEMLQDLVNIKR